MPKVAKLGMWKAVKMNTFVYVWFHTENDVLS